MRSVMLLVVGALFGVMASFAIGAWPRGVTDTAPCLEGALASARAGSARAGPTGQAPAAAKTSPVAPATVAVPTPATALSTSAAASATSGASATTATDLPPNTPQAIATLPPSSVRNLLLPVKGVKPSELVDTFTQARSAGRVHDAIDIMAPRGTPVLATNDGHVVKLFTSVRGGLTVYQFDPQDRVIYYYAHLDRYVPDLAEGQALHRGDIIGFVGSTGNASADAPHLHFEIEMLGPKKEWWHGTSINPYGRFAGQRVEGVASRDSSR